MLGRVVPTVVCDGMGGLDKGEFGKCYGNPLVCKWVEQELPTKLDTSGFIGHCTEMEIDAKGIDRSNTKWQ